MEEINKEDLEQFKLFCKGLFRGKPINDYIDLILKEEREKIIKDIRLENLLVPKRLMGLEIDHYFAKGYNYAVSELNNKLNK